MVRSQYFQTTSTLLSPCSILVIVLSNAAAVGQNRHCKHLDTLIETQNKSSRLWCGSRVGRLSTKHGYWRISKARMCSRSAGKPLVWNKKCPFFPFGTRLHTTVVVRVALQNGTVRGPFCKSFNHCTIPELHHYGTTSVIESMRLLLDVFLPNY